MALEKLDPIVEIHPGINLASLPSEMVLQISSELDVTAGLNGQHPEFVRNLKLTHICSSWRKILYSSPLFWSHIDLGWPAEVVDHFLFNSKQCPLTLVSWDHEALGVLMRRTVRTASTKIDESRTRAAIDNLHRVQVLRFKPPFTRTGRRDGQSSNRLDIFNPSRTILSNPAPMLQELSLSNIHEEQTNENPFMGQLPQLRHLTLHRCPGLQPYAFHAPKLLSLKVQSAKGLSLSTIRLAVGAFPVLQSLTLEGYLQPFGGQQASLMESPVSAPRLQHLTIHPVGGTDRQISDWLQAMSLPEIRTVNLSYLSTTNNTCFHVFPKTADFIRLLASIIEVQLTFDNSSFHLGLLSNISRIGTSAVSELLQYNGLRDPPTASYHQALADSLASIPVALSPLAPLAFKIVIATPLPGPQFPVADTWGQLFALLTKVEELSVKSYLKVAITPIILALNSHTSCPALRSLEFTGIQVDAKSVLPMVRSRQSAGVGLKKLSFNDCQGLDARTLAGLAALIKPTDTADVPS
ncbi:hypothetical protein SISSUDRAFT_1060015 [Sistotremastrum suecicum HHB10207 ss-3]|uniref:F-box domain-containing protein n=1 Tax=Sistotremastrum suecicum HHB10207 ss-3 TaxID=1314776 RepID=A0A166FMF0_9AGAM|nr:hypothetical protein SISSUDRAFT_1060015 [Sistotremastrum suecicum HHB10207 ss-3]